MRIFLLFWLLQSAAAQIQPSSEFILGDTTSRLEITDLFIGKNGTVYSTGQYVDDSIALYISAISPSGQKFFELFRRKGFEEKGRIIRPYDQDHFIVCGHSEDKTGTFNVRLLKLTYSGTVVWDTTFGDDGTGTMEMPNDLAVDSKGNIIIGGISQTSEIKYLLLKFSSSGQLLWWRKSVPFETGVFTVHDIVLDADDNIYGLTNNTFIADTSHGTVIKWDTSGNVVWSRNFNLSCYEERGVNLLLSGDTLTAAGTPWIDGQNPTAVTLVSLRTNGELIAYRTIPLFSSQQGIRDLRLIPNGSMVLLNEAYVPPMHRLYTIVLSRALTTMYLDSTLANSPLKGVITNIAGNAFDVIRYGGQFSKVHYLVSGNGVSASPPQVFNAGNRTVELVSETPPFIAAASRISGSNSDRVHIAFYPELTTSSTVQQHEAPAALELFSAYPNPFNPSTTLSFRIPKRSYVTLTVYDLLGRRVAELLARELEAGRYSWRWNAGNVSGGIYFVLLQTKETVRAQRLLLLR